MRTLKSELRRARRQPLPNLFGIRLKRFFTSTGGAIGLWRSKEQERNREAFNELHERLTSSRGSQAMLRAAGRGLRGKRRPDPAVQSHQPRGAKQ